jgi:hypothetical protein
LAKLLPGNVPIDAVSRAKDALDALGCGGAPEPGLLPAPFDRRTAGRKAVRGAGCVAEHANPRWKDTAKRLLAGLGIEVLPDPGFTCCGCTLGHAGAPDAQAAMQQQNIEAWRRAGRPMMVVFCATCRCGLRAYARKDLGLTMSELGPWRENLVSLSELLGDTRFRVGEAAPTAVRYHRPCHGAGGNQDLGMLRQIMASASSSARGNPCCGFGGLTKLTSPELSEAVATRALAVYRPAARRSDRVRLFGLRHPAARRRAKGCARRPLAGDHGLTPLPRRVMPPATPVTAGSGHAGPPLPAGRLRTPGAPRASLPGTPGASTTFSRFAKPGAKPSRLGKPFPLGIR